MPAQDLIDRLDKALETAYAGPPPKPASDEPTREPAVQAPSVRDESDLLSWAENFAATKPKDIATPSGDARADKERAVRAFKADVPAASGSTFGRNVAKGFLNIGETSLGFFESITDILGASKAKSYLKEKGDRLAELNRAIPNEIESVTDIEDAGDAGAFAAMAVGQLAPQISAALLGGVAARALTSGAGAVAQLVGTIGGTVIPSVIQESGGIYRGVRDETGVEAPVTSLTFGAIAGALEAVTPSRFLLKVFDTGTDEIKRKSLASLLKLSAREILKETGKMGVAVGKEAAKSGLTEFTTEVFQEGIALGANKFADGTYDLINSKNAVRLIDAGLMGLVGGAALGSVEPSIERAIKYTRQQEEYNAIKRPAEADPGNAVKVGEVGATLQTGGDQLPPSGTVQEVTPAVVAPPVIESKRGALPQPEPEYLYHVTTADRLAGVGQLGLTPNSKRAIGAPSLDSNAKGKIFLSDASGLSFWTMRAGEFVEHNFDDYSEKGIAPVVLRVKKQDAGTLEVDAEGSRDSGNQSFTSRDKIAPDKLEVWNGTQWVSPSVFKESGLAFDDDGYIRNDSPLTKPSIDTPIGSISERQVTPPPPIPPVPSTGQSQYGTGQLLTYGSTPTIPPNTPEGLGQALQETSETGTLLRQGELQRGAAESTAAAQTRQTTLEGALDSIADEVNALQTELNSLEPKLKFDSRSPTGMQALAQMRYIQGRIDGLRKVHADLVSKANALISGMPDDGGRRGAVSPETVRRLLLLDSGITKLSSQFRKSVSESTIFSVPEFKRRVAASNLSSEAKSFIDAFLNSKAAKYLEGARFRIAEALDGGWEGSYFKGLVEIAETATPGVAPQEFMHRIFDLLPEADKQAIEALRQERLAELNAQYPNDPLLASIAAGPMTTANFVAANPTDQQITDFYPVTTTDEFFAHMMSDKFVARTKGAASRGLISTIREAIKDLVAAIKKGFRLPITADEMFRNVINGRYDVTPDGGTQSEQRRGAVVPITRVKTIERVAAFAKPGAERQTEALLATGQVTSVRNILDRVIMSVVPASIRERVERFVGFTRMDAISTYVRDVLMQNPVEYRAARAQLTDEGQKNLLAVHTNRGHELFEQNAVSVRNKWEHQQKKLSGTAWAGKLRDLARKRAKQDAVQSAREAVELAIKNGLDRAVTRIRESGGNDTIFESAEQEREFYETLLSRSGQITLAMESIANALGFTPDGLSFVFGARGNNANDLLAFYHAMVPPPTPDPVTGRNPQFAINRVAAEILARNVTLRQRMVAAIWTEATELTKPIKDLEDQIVRDMQTENPRTVIGKLIRQAGNLNRNEGKAAAAFLVKFREVTREVELLEALDAAVAVIDATLADPQYRAVRTEVATDARAEVRPQAAKALELAEPFYAKSHIYLPDGTIVELNMFPDKVRFDDELNQKLDPALTALNNWLFDAVNIDHPSRFFYKQQYDLFHALWTSNMAVNPPKQLVAFRNLTFKVMDSMLGMLGPMLQNIGTRSTSLSQTALAVWESANHLMGDWLAKWNPLIVESIGRATKSHLAISGGQTRGNAAKEWHDKVFSPMAAREQDPARPGLKVGDVIPESGEVVTQQDLDALHLQVAATRAAHEVDVVAGRKGLAIPNLVEDRYIPGLKFFRGSLAFAKNMLMRRFDHDGIHIATAFSELKTKIEPLAPADQRRALVNFWNDHFDYVKSAAIHRNAQYSNLTDFEAALETAVPEIANGGITTAKELVDFVASLSTTTDAEIEAWLFGELDRHATAITKATANKADLGILEFSAIENQNPFTVGRGPEVAPPAWYSYGFTDSPSIYNFSMSGGNFYFEILMKSLNSVSADLAAEISRQATEEKRLAQTLGTGGAAQANLRQNQNDIRLGRQTATLEDLNDFKRGLDKLILMLNERFSPGGKRLEEEFGLANKLLSNFTSGVLASSFTLARNALEGGFVQNGFRMSRLFGSTLQGFPRAFLGLMQTLLKVGGSGLLSLPIAAGKVLANVPAATGTFFTTGNLLKAEQSLFGTAMREIATTMYERVKMFRDLEELGLGMSAYPAEQVQASIQFPLTFGQILQEKGVATSPFPRLLQTIGPALFSWYDANLNLFIRPVFSRAGDQIANLAVANATLGGLHNLEARLRKLFSVYRDAGVKIASLNNHVFTPSEILGKWFGMERSQTNLREIQQWFHNSLIPLNESVFDYLTRLETDPKANWLTPEEKMRLIVKNVEEVNVPTPSNRPLALRKNLVMRAVGALLGWNIKALRGAIHNFTGIAASDPKFSQTQLQIATYTLFLATLAWSALGQAGIEEILRFLGWTINRERRATRQPWEQEGLDQAKQWTVYGFNSIPFVATAVNMMFSDLPNKAGFSPTLLVQNKIIDVLNYVSGAIRTRDITYRLPQLIRGFNPLSPAVMNRLPAVAGSVEALNASRLYRRYGDLDLIRRSTGGPGAGATATRLTPYGDRILNALAQGDYESAETLKAEAVKVATQLGKPDPERSVEQSIVSRLPHRRAFKETPNAAQMARVMAKMSSSERAQVTQLNDTLKTGLDRMGIKTDFVDQPRLTDAPRSRLGGGLRLDRPRRGRRSRLIGLSNRRSRTSSRLRSRTRRRRRLSAFA